MVEATEQLSPTRNPPIARGLPLVGVLPEFLLDPPRVLTRIAKEYPGEVPALPFGPVRVYAVTHPDHVQHVLHENWRNYGKGAIWRSARQLLGNGLITAEGEEWLRNRRLMQPLFSSKYLKSLADIMTQVIAGAVDRLEALASHGTPIDIADEMLQLTQHVLLKALFSTSISRDDARRLGKSIVSAFEALNYRLFLYFLPEWFPLPGERKFRAAIKDIDEGMARLIRERAPLDETSDDLLSLLLRARDEESGAKLSERQVQDELVTLFIAGSETTAVALTWLWYVLAERPEIDRKLRQEVDTVLGGRTPTFADLGNLNYVRMTFLEAMRLFPPIWFLPRVARQDDVIGRCRITAGSTILLSQYVTHRDPMFWGEGADEFDPERFDSDRAADRHRYAYYPFGGGARQCIGNQFAIMEAQLAVSMIVQRFRPRLVPGHQVTPRSASTLRPRNGLRMTLDRL
jgi:cytochrome P450